MESVQKYFLRNSALTDSKVNPNFTSFYLLQPLMSLAEKKSYASSSLAAENKTRRERTCQLAILTSSWSIIYIG
jgi:hypothetical protein